MSAGFLPSVFTHEQELSASCARGGSRRLAHRSHRQVRKQHEVNQWNDRIFHTGPRDLPRNGRDEITLRMDRRLESQANALRRETHISIRKENPLPNRGATHSIATPLFAVPSWRKWLTFQSTNTRIFERDSINDGTSPVDRLIVMHNHFEIDPSTRKHRPNALFNIRHFVARRNADRDSGELRHGFAGLLNRCSRSSVTHQIRGRHDCGASTAGDRYRESDHRDVDQVESLGERSTRFKRRLDKSIATPRPVTRSQRS